MRTASSLLLTSSLLLSGCGRDAQDCALALTCPEYADAGPLVDAPVDPSCAGDPMSKDAGPKDGCGVFVSPDAVAGGDGSLTRPLTSLQAAIDLAATSQKPVFACAKEFAEAVSLPAGLTVYGGLDCDAGWVWTAGKRTTVKPAAEGGKPNEIALRVGSGAATTRLSDVDVIAPDGADPGASSIAVLVEGVALELARCDFTAGNGAAGAKGEDGAAMDLGGQSGAVGLDICMTGLMGPGAAGPVKMCSTGGSSTGGNGGDGGGLSGGMLLAAGSGKDGAPADATMSAAGKGGTGQDTMVCVAGTTGADGAPGDPGAGAAADSKALGFISASGYIGVGGQAGTDGKPGQGGGGGGGSKGALSLTCNNVTMPHIGASGGSGGTGGCGGQHGGGGKPGGSSIALVSLGATLTFEMVNLTAQSGGAGGQGGAGQSGGNGGFGNNGGFGAGAAKNACRGGDGGTGGEGGPGGGGRGGHSIGIAHKGGPAPSGAAITTAMSGGMGGLGGMGSGMSGGQGAAGMAAGVQAFN